MIRPPARASSRMYSWAAGADSQVSSPANSTTVTPCLAFTLMSICSLHAIGENQAPGRFAARPIRLDIRAAEKGLKDPVHNNICQRDQGVVTDPYLFLARPN